MRKIFSDYDPNLIIVRGAGDLATGVIQKIYRAGFRVLALETPKPSTIRRTVALSSAVLDQKAEVEDLKAYRVESLEACPKIWASSGIPVFIDPSASSLDKLKPVALVDAIMAKKNFGTHTHMAPISIALGPGFTAPDDVDIVVETCQGHGMGRIIEKGTALPNTGVPGRLGREGRNRVLYAPQDGVVRHFKTIGDAVKEGETIMLVGEEPVKAPFSGVLRGLISEAIGVRKGLKIVDIDPRTHDEFDCHSISFKAQKLGRAVLEASLYLARKKRLDILTKPRLNAIIDCQSIEINFLDKEQKNFYFQ